MLRKWISFLALTLLLSFSGAVLPTVRADEAAGTTLNDAADSVDFTFNLNTITEEDVPTAEWVDKGVNYLITRIISIAAQVIGGVSVLGFSIGGLFMLLSAGNEQFIEKGKAMMLYSVLGLVFVLGSYLLVVTIQTLVSSIFTEY